MPFISSPLASFLGVANSFKSFSQAAVSALALSAAGQNLDSYSDVSDTQAVESVSLAPQTANLPLAVALGLGLSAVLSRQSRQGSNAQPGSYRLVKIGRYTLMRAFDKGMSEFVYLAKPPDPKSPLVVIKKNWLGSMCDFEREIRAMQRVRSPYVMSCTRSCDGTYFVMPYAEGGDLFSWIEKNIKDKNQARREVRVVQRMREVLQGLKAIHEENIVHRDIRAVNIFMSRSHAKIGDFGLCFILDENDQRAEPMDALYERSPEAIRDGDPDFRDDLYAVGAVLFHCLVGEEPYYCEDLDSEKAEREIRYKILRGPIPDPRQNKNNIPVSSELAAIVRKAMAKTRAQRYQNTDQMLMDLDLFLQGQPLRYAAIPL